MFHHRAIVIVLAIAIMIPSLAFSMTENELSGLWFVELSSPPAADGTKLATVKQEKQAWRNEAAKAGVKYKERYAFDVLWNGFSVSIGSSQVGKLSRIPGTKAIYPVMSIAIPAVRSVENPDLATAIIMTGADIVQSDLGYTGEGVRVAVMDTGVDYDHPDLGGCFGTGCRVRYGYDFVGDAFTGGNTPVPDPDPDDCNGHGTHVAGIVGADGEAVGVAPGVTFGAYRVFGCSGSTTADIMVAAMERALADKMDVLNMSIGAAFQWPQYPTAQASNRLVNRGMVVVASIGNNGTAGVYSAGAPGLGEKVIGVASFDNSHVNALTFTVNAPGDGRSVPYLPITVSDNPPTSGDSPEIVYVGRGCNVDTYLGNPSGKVALIERGLCTFNEKYQRAISAGAVGAMIFNSSTGGPPGALFAGGGVAGAAGKFCIALTRNDGLYISGLTGSSAHWTDTLVQVVNPSGGLISSFSSYGLAPDLSLKPDIGAPGGLIRSTYPVELGSYAVVSGTSMSSPHVAGAAALLLQAHPNTPSQIVRTIFQNSADPKNWQGNPGLGFLDQVHRQGAGMIDIDDSILATTKIEPGKIAVGEGEAGPSVHTLYLQNNAGSSVTYNLSHSPALATGGNTFNPGAFTTFATAGFSAASVVVPAHGTASVDVTITPPATAGRQFGGYIVFTPVGGGQVYRVPYAGFSGDYQSIVPLTSAGIGFPFLASTTDGVNFSVHPSGRTYTMVGFDVPYILVHLDHQVRYLRMEVKDPYSGKSFHRALHIDYFPRNSASTSFFALDWDGVTTNGKKSTVLPDGDYIIELSVLKALGDVTNSAHIQTWTSPVITIDRP